MVSNGQQDGIQEICLDRYRSKSNYIFDGFLFNLQFLPRSANLNGKTQQTVELV
jgi:hypothetical protein